MSGQFELKQDEDTGRKYWFGAEDGWETEIGDEEGTLILRIDNFPVGTKLIFIDPTDGVVEVL